MKSRHSTIVYFTIWFLLVCASIGFNIANIRWTHVNLVHGVFFVCLVGLLHTSVMEFVMQTGITLILGGKTRHVKRKDPQGLTLMLNYNLLAYNKAQIDECFKTMYESYMGNLSPFVIAVLVSVTDSQKLKEHEISIRDKYRRKIYCDIYEEGIKFARGRTSSIDRLRIKHIWNLYRGIESDRFEQEYLGRICSVYADNFMLLQRRTRVLRKCGQYQDLMLHSAGYTTAFSYCDRNFYGSKAREYGESLFHPSTDTDRLANSYYDYTLVLDADTKVMRGVAFELLKIAAAHPDKGIIQPAIRIFVEKEDSLFMWLESARNLIFEPMTNAIFACFGQCGYFGKALINNRIYIEKVIGTPEKPIESVPIDVLSHDTIEGALLKPMYAGDVSLLETPPYNYITWYLREKRWNKGELILAMYYWKTVFGRPMRWLQKIIQGQKFVSTKLRTEMKLDLVTAYIAHSALRQMAMKPLLLIGILIHFRMDFHVPYLPIIVVMFIIIIIPKFATCRRGFVCIVILETIVSVLQFTPEAIVGCVRIFQAFRSLFFLSITWTPQHEVEEKFKKSNPFLKILKHLWGYSVISAIAGTIVIAFTTDYFLLFMLLTVFMLPLFTYVTSLSKSRLLAEFELFPRRHLRKLRRQSHINRRRPLSHHIRTTISQPVMGTDTSPAFVPSISAGIAYRNIAYNSPYLPYYVLR